MQYTEHAAFTFLKLGAGADGSQADFWSFIVSLKKTPNFSSRSILRLGRFFPSISKVKKGCLAVNGSALKWAPTANELLIIIWSAAVLKKLCSKWLNYKIKSYKCQPVPARIIFTSLISLTNLMGIADWYTWNKCSLSWSYLCIPLWSYVKLLK